MPQILKRLRAKFVLTTTVIVAVLVILIASAYCISVYSSSSQSVNLALEHAINASVGKDPNAPHPQNLSEGEDRKGFGGNIGSEQAPEGEEQLDSDQRIDLFRGQMALVYSLVVSEDGTILRTDSPAINLDEQVLENAIESVLNSPSFSMQEGVDISGELGPESLYYRAKVSEGSIYLAFADSSNVDSRLNEALFGSLLVAGLVLVLTVLVSFFLARLFLRPVEEAWTKQRRFIADASHELKTPLTVIMANIEIIRSEPTASVASNMKWLDGTMAESERMQGLIADLLLLARMDDKQQSPSSLNYERVNFSELVEGSLVSIDAIAFERGLPVEEDIESGIYVEGVQSQLVRLPDILLDNACKYAAPKGLIKVSLTAESDKVIFRVFNAGPEIPEHELNRLFDRFYRADESRSNEIPGYGLGLSIAHTIVEECGGTIEVENIAGEGVAFTVILKRSS
ncbi:MAG: sensor histidine kinase [Raoultibacter sp.]|jgi:two-component system sensor histidine kinase CiaH